MKPLIIFLSIVFALSSCYDSHKDKKDECKIGKYVYVDSQRALHIKNPCVLGMAISDNDGNRQFQPIIFVETKDITFEGLSGFCPWCVDDEQYDELMGIVERNKIPKKKPNPMR